MKFYEIIFVQFLGLALAFIIPTSAQAALVSDLIITEIMVNPSAVNDTNGEWFEVFNPTLEAVNLSGIQLSDDGTNRHIISADSSLLVNPGEYFVFGKNSDRTSNGDVSLDYAYGSAFTLSNSGDEIVFSVASTNVELLRLNYAGGFAPDGTSMELMSNTMLAENYQASVVAYGLGDLGTPGSAGSFAFSAPSPVPLPGSAWLLISGLAGFVSLKRKRKS